MPTRTVSRHRSLVIRFLGVLVLGCTAACLMCGPAVAQAPKPKAGKAATPGKDAGKKAKPKTKPKPKPAASAHDELGPDEGPPKAKREDPYLHVSVAPGMTKQVVARLRMDVFKAMQSGRYEGDQQQSLQTYYRKWILPSWTQESNYNLLPKFRNDLRNELRPGKASQTHSDALELLLGALTRLSNENFHPAVRCNAMLALSDLNEQEPVGINGVPTPLPDAVPILITALTDEKQIDAVRVAALLGLARHARLGIADQQLVTQKLVPALMKLATEKTPPATRSPDGHEWMRCQAIDVLGLLRNVGNNNAVLKALGDIVADKKDIPEKKGREMLVRCAASRALGSLNYAGVSGLNPRPLAESLAGLAIETCGRETAVRASEEEAEVTVVRRRLLAQLNAVIIGLNGADEQHKGIRGLAQETPARDHVEKLCQAVRNVTAVFDRKDIKDIDDAQLAKLIGEAAAAVGQVIAAPAAGAAPPAENGAKPPDDKSKTPPTGEKEKAPPEAPKKPGEAKGF